MPNEYDDEFDDEDEAPAPQVLDKNIRRQLREVPKLRKENEELKEWKASKERSEALDLAGLPDTPQSKWFKSHYNGEMTLEAIRREAEQAGILVPPPVEVDATLQAELEAQRKAQGATVGSIGVLPDPMAELKERFAKATSKKEVEDLLREADAKGMNLRLGTAL